MKFLKWSGIVIIVVITGIAVLFYIRSKEPIVFHNGPEFAYEGLENIQRTSSIRYREYIELPDGEKLATTVHLPENSSPAAYPTVLIYLPYSASTVVPEMTFFERILSKYNTGVWGPAYDETTLIGYQLETLLYHGYAVVFADMRGTGSSTGSVASLDPIHKNDVNEILNWIAHQPWSNQKIGMMGLSYYAWSQFVAASVNSPYLKCIAPESIYFNGYAEGMRPGGILAQRWVANYDKVLRNKNLNLWNNTIPTMPAFPSEPVTDENNNGAVLDEIPLLEFNKNTEDYYLDNPIFTDGRNPEESFYVNLTRQHAKNLYPAEQVGMTKFIDDSITYSGRVIKTYDYSIDRMLVPIRESGIPVLLTGGFFDGFSQGMAQSYSNLQETNPAYLVMMPKGHYNSSYSYAQWFDYLYFPQDDKFSMVLQFFDKYLKGQNNSLDNTPPVRIFTAFKGWDHFSSWPPKETVYSDYYLDQDHQLSKNDALDSLYIYAVDFSHSASYNASGFNPMQMYMTGLDSLMIRNEHDKKCLVFEMPELEEDMQVTGHPIVNFSISSNRDTADLYVYLSDVDTTGTVHYVSEGKLRAGWHEVHDNDEMVDGLYDVEPELPWHSFKKEDHDPAPLAEGQVLTMKFALKPVSWNFRKGHKIRISIAGADHENDELNPVLCPDNTLESCVPANLYIHTKDSKITLPVIDNPPSQKE